MPVKIVAQIKMTNIILSQRFILNLHSVIGMSSDGFAISVKIAGRQLVEALIE